ncbi:MAG: hypothetical protein JXQ84_04405, partial [Rhodospirillaceae bacterium]|nr:hypothetical protein [Rhodospirillaceae bacterium]
AAIQVCARALRAIGCEPITSFDDGSAEAEVAGMLYGSVCDAVLSSYPWSFATAQRSLAAVTAVPVADFAYAYPLPDDFLRALSVGYASAASGRGVVYRIHERRIHSDASGVVLTYIFRPDPRTFPPFFDQALISRLAAEFCLPLTENTARSELQTKLAQKEFQHAKSIDAQQQTPNRFEDFSLLEVRR